jgi:hypothetical protein
MKKILILGLLLISVTLVAFAQSDSKNEKLFTDNFFKDSCTFLSTGKNQYFILEPGYQLVLKGSEGKDTTVLMITVLNEIRMIGNIETRVVEENESVNGKTEEISRNFFAFCKNTGSIFYFGEEVDIYKDGKVVNHSGAWIAEGKNKAGIAMPGQILLGAKYYQEIAPGIAMDRAEIISSTETMKTPAGNFSTCLKTLESTALDSKEKEYKFYAPGIGLIKDENLLLTKYGFVK